MQSTTAERIMSLILIVIISTSFCGVVFASDREISGFLTSNGERVYCSESGNKCVLKPENTNLYIYGTKTIDVLGVTQTNLVISHNTNITIQNGDNSASDNLNKVEFIDFNSIEISSSSTLTIDNNARSSFDLKFISVSALKIVAGSSFIINDNATYNFSDDLNQNSNIRYDNNITAGSNLIALHPGKIDLSNTNVINDGNLIIDLDRNLQLSSPVSDSNSDQNECIADLVSYAGELEVSSSDDDGTTTTDSGEENDNQTEQYCYKYYNFSGCKEIQITQATHGGAPATYEYYPEASDADSVYLCYNISDKENIVFKDFSAGESSNVEINSDFYINTEQISKTFYLNNQEQTITPTAVDEDKNVTGYSNILFNNYTGKIPKRINSQGKGDITINTCGPISVTTSNVSTSGCNGTSLSVTPRYNVCKLIYIHPSNSLRLLNNQDLCVAGKILDLNKNCNYNAIHDQISNYLLTDSNISTTPVVFGTIQHTNSGQLINPTFTTTGNYGLFDINNNRKSVIDNKVTNNFFRIYLNPPAKVLNVIEAYYFRFLLNGVNSNSDLNYPDMNLNYVFKIHK